MDKVRLYLGINNMKKERFCFFYFVLRSICTNFARNYVANVAPRGGTAMCFHGVYNKNKI